MFTTKHFNREAGYLFQLTLNWSTGKTTPFYKQHYTARVKWSEISRSPGRWTTNQPNRLVTSGTVRSDQEGTFPQHYATRGRREGAKPAAHARSGGGRSLAWRHHQLMVSLVIVLSTWSRDFSHMPLALQCFGAIDNGSAGCLSSVHH